jgi:hypothetical protein
MEAEQMKPTIPFYIVLLSTLLLSGPYSNLEAKEDDSLQIVMLDLNSGDEILEQCSRKKLIGHSFWQPTFDLTWIIEEKLETYLKQKPIKDGSPLANAFKNKDFKPLPLSNWNRQVIGFQSDDMEYVYLNYYPKRDLPLRDDRFIPVNVCGGGESYWGVVFNLKTSQFEHFEVNQIGRPVPLFIRDEPQIGGE